VRWRRRNLLGLSRHDPGLAGLLGQAADPAGLEAFRGPWGRYTARGLGPDGRRTLMHSSVDPLGQSRRALEASLPGAWLQGRVPEAAVCVVLGLGLGWPGLAASELLAPDAALWLADTGPAGLSAGMDVLDLAPLWRRKRLRLLFGPPDPALLARLAGCGGLAVSVAEPVVDAQAGGRDWTLAWVRALGAFAAGAAHVAGLPDWLDLVCSGRMRGEQP